MQSRYLRPLASLLLMVALVLAPTDAHAQAGFVNANNSSVAVLSGGSVFTGVSEDISGYQSVTVTAFANQVSAAGGLSLQFSPDNVNWDIQHGYTVTASVARTVIEPVQARYFRIVYTNGATTQTAFRLQTIFEASPTSNDRATSQQILIQPSQVSGVTATTTTRATVTGLDAYSDLDVLINITASGTATGTLQIWLEDSPDGGTTWDDLVSSNTFALGAAAVTQHFFVAGKIATSATQGGAAAIETLAAGTVRAGPFGNQIRVREKITSPSGSPVGATYTITAVVKR